VGDERGRDELNLRLLKGVFGPDVLEKAFGEKPPQSLPSAREVGQKLLQDWHGFFLQVYDHSHTAEWWGRILGKERVVRLPRTEDMAEVQACIIGLTEGILDLQSAVDFLKEAKVKGDYAKRIVNACAEIPLGLQTTFPNFGKIPAAGVRFASREDIWPVDDSRGAESGKDAKSPASPTKRKKKDWKL